MTLTKAVAYYRMSSDKQETSIADQRSAVQDYANEKGYQIIREYQDAGVSGWKSEERKQFQRMIDDAQHGQFQAVLCWDIDRFSRFPVLEANHYFYLLDSAGVHLSTVAQGRLDFDSIGGLLQASVTQFGKSEYCRDLARNTSRGLRKRREAGKWVGGVPLGYRCDDGVLVHGPPEELALVRRIFGTRAKGYGIHTIAKKLNEEGLLTSYSKPWSYSAVDRILRNETFIGNTVVKESRARFCCSMEPGARAEGTHEPIIDCDLWEKVQAMTSRPRKSHDRQGTRSSPLAGLLFCGSCGGPMYQTTPHPNNRYFVCSTAHKARGCGKNTINADKLEDAIYTKLRKTLLADSLEKLTVAIQRILDRRPKPDDNSKQISKLDRQIERAASRLLTVNDSLVPDLEKQLLALKQQRESLAAPKAPQASLPSAEKIAAQVWELERVIREASPPEARNVLQQIIDRVELRFVTYGNGRQRRRYRFTGGTINLCKPEAPLQPASGGCQGSVRHFTPNLQDVCDYRDSAAFNQPLLLATNFCMAFSVAGLT